MYPDFQKVDTDNLTAKINDTMKIAGKKLKTNSKDKNQYMASQFLPPKPKTDRLAEQLPPKQASIAKKLQEHTKSVVNENRNIKRAYSSLEKDYNTIEEELEILERKYSISLNLLSTIQEKHASAVKELLQKCTTHTSDINEWELKYNEESEKVSKLEDELTVARTKISKYCPRNVNKREKRAKEKIVGLQNYAAELEVYKVDIEVRDNEISQLETEKLKVKQEKDQLLGQITNLKKMNTRLRNKVDATIESNNIEMKSLESKLKNANDRISEMEVINDILESNEVKTFENGIFTSQIRQCIMTLSTQDGVSLKNVNSVIKTVLHNLAGKMATKLPSHGTLCRLMNEAKFIANHHVAQEMIANTNVTEKQVACLHSDGTTKHHREYESYQTTLPNGKTLSMGLMEVSSQSGERNMAAFKQTLKELAKSLGSDEQKTQAKLIASLQTTMSDQGASNNTFFEMVDEFRKEVLPIAVENWENLSSDTREDISQVAHFYCKLHLLGNFETNVIKTAEEFESSVCDGKNPKAFASESCGTQRLARNASKALHHTGSAKSGRGGLWESYVMQNSIDDKLINIEHSRINTTFYQGGAVYHHRKEIQNFLSSLPQNEKNTLLECLEFDINEPVYLASCRAFGMLDKKVFGPFWRLCNASGSILEMNAHLELMQSSFLDWSQDASQLMTKDFVLFESVKVHRDSVFESLFKENEQQNINQLTKLALELYCQQCLIILERQGKDQLPGGKYFIPQENIRAISQCVPTTNVISERDFAMLDWLMKFKPHSSTLHKSTLIQWKNNKTAAYLDSLDSNDREKLLEKARKNAPKIASDYKASQLVLREEKLAKLQSKQEEKEKKEENAAAKAVSLTNKLVKFGGVWSSVDEVEGKISNYKSEGWTDKQLTEAVYCQICYFRDVIKAKGKRELFQKTSKQKAKTVDELTNNLKKILEENSIQSEEESSSLSYFSLDQVTQNVENQKKSLIIKLKNERIQRQASKQKGYLDQYTKNPSSLVNKNVRHLVRDPGEDAIWCEAVVHRCEPHKSDPIKTNYVITYNDFPEEGEWKFNLLADMKKGDLLVEGDVY